MSEGLYCKTLARGGDTSALKPSVLSFICWDVRCQVRGARHRVSVRHHWVSPCAPGWSLSPVLGIRRGLPASVCHPGAEASCQPCAKSCLLRSTFSPVLFFCLLGVPAQNQGTGPSAIWNFPSKLFLSFLRIFITMKVWWWPGEKGTFPLIPHFLKHFVWNLLCPPKAETFRSQSQEADKLVPPPDAFY